MTTGLDRDLSQALEACRRTARAYVVDITARRALTPAERQAQFHQVADALVALVTYDHQCHLRSLERRNLGGSRLHNDQRYAVGIPDDWTPAQWVAHQALERIFAKVVRERHAIAQAVIDRRLKYERIRQIIAEG